jgi:hypothetical protein
MIMTFPNDPSELLLLAPTPLMGLADKERDPSDEELEILQDLAPWEDIPISVPLNSDAQGCSLLLNEFSKPSSPTQGHSLMQDELSDPSLTTPVIEQHLFDFTVVAPTVPPKLPATLRALELLSIEPDLPPKVKLRKRISLKERVDTSVSSSENPSSLPNSCSEPPSVSLIGPTTFAQLLTSDEPVICAALHIRPKPSDNSEQNSKSFDPSDLETLKEFIPTEYHDFANVFSAEEARQLLLHRLYNHAIDLEPDSKAPFRPIYNMLASEQETLRKFIDDMLSKGFI